ncbi:hypothetical protein GDO81_017121 [Engystomops pustulosus]|nr:hypothetical protein GDO81_017121 [Engystomops pustulosus]
MVYVQEVLPDGDGFRDGRLRSGDQLLSINKDSMIGVTNEEAKRILARARFRQDSCTDVSFIPNTGRIPSVSGSSSSSSLQHRMMGNGLAPCRLKVHVRSPECRHENNVPSSSPDICPPELTISAPVSPPNHRTSAGNKQKVSLDPHVRIKEEKLDLVLQFLGMDVSDEKRRELRQGLITDCQGTVAYGGGYMCPSGVSTALIVQHIWHRPSNEAHSTSEGVSSHCCALCSIAPPICTKLCPTRIELQLLLNSWNINPYITVLLLLTTYRNV